MKLPQTLTFLALLLVAPVQAFIYVTNPIQGTVCHGGQDCPVQFVDNGEAPLLGDIGTCSVGLYTGEYVLVQSLPSVNVATTSSFSFTPNPSVGPNGLYYLVFFDCTLASYTGFSATFTLDGMTGTTQGGTSTGSSSPATQSSTPLTTTGTESPATTTITTTVTSSSVTLTTTVTSSSVTFTTTLTTLPVTTSLTTLTTTPTTTRLTTATTSSAPTTTTSSAAIRAGSPGTLVISFILTCISAMAF